ncbi:iron complex transport system substrate-binding protein [Sporomusaceae bacterium BoRhaA]|uniref:ABC transporter substrate-binding protein n=1 Tax=Pelorhabdus rhamnosifermentans TaxID=2772457 RepID=UPI001C0611B2|nr:ABC transporter substrate-binding protein [Pelorhabdus rhamnosifermentans]MBU2703473.1 iron complex transport system substrate-binding protein [Pelorhabdus rhamnosifermentans]
MQMKNIIQAIICMALIFSIVGCAGQHDLVQQLAAESSVKRAITDMAGRTVMLPQKIHKIYPASPIGSVFVYTIDPELLIGWSYHMASDESKFILPNYRKLPVVGGWSAQNATGNIEEIMRLKPDVILIMKTLNNSDVAAADELQDLTHIPVVIIDGAIEKMDQAYLMAGTVLGQEERTKELAAYCRETLDTIAAGKNVLAQRRPVTVYYAEGHDGLESEPMNSEHSQIIELVGGVNVVGQDIPGGINFGRTRVLLEQVLIWNPEVILIGYFRDGESSSFPQIMVSKEWKDIQAVRNHRVYEIPNHPFNWFDRPPAINRLIGIKWVANLLYPDVYPLDLRAEVQYFYTLFYHYQLSEEETKELLERTQN